MGMRPDTRTHSAELWTFCAAFSRTVHSQLFERFHCALDHSIPLLTILGFICRRNIFIRFFVFFLNLVRKRGILYVHCGPIM